MTPRAALERGLEELAIELPGEGRDKLIEYTALLAKWNRTYNLTSIRDPLTMVSHHLLDSLAVLPHLPLGAGAQHLADAGSGAGLPGIPLALARPQWQIALIESNQKKAAFLRQAAIELGLDNVEVQAQRAEAWRPAQALALVISRALAELGEFVAACRHLVAPHGVLAAMKGKRPEKELRALPPEVQAEVIALRVPLVEGERHLVLCRLAA
jgi:16S rRNA (guanine527-N7)-methyltransferase